MVSLWSVTLCFSGGLPWFYPFLQELTSYFHHNGDSSHDFEHHFPQPDGHQLGIILHGNKISAPIGHVSVLQLLLHCFATLLLARQLTSRWWSKIGFFENVYRRSLKCVFFGKYSDLFIMNHQIDGYTPNCQILWPSLSCEAMSKNFGQVSARKEGKHRQARGDSGKKLYKWSTCIWRNLSFQMVFKRTYGWHCHWLRKVENIDVNYSTPRLYHCNSPLALLDFWA